MSIYVPPNLCLVPWCDFRITHPPASSLMLKGAYFGSSSRLIHHQINLNTKAHCTPIQMDAFSLGWKTSFSHKRLSCWRCCWAWSWHYCYVCNTTAVHRLALVVHGTQKYEWGHVVYYELVLWTALGNLGTRRAIVNHIKIRMIRVTMDRVFNSA